MTYIPWPQDEDATLLAEYNASGIAAACRALPDRSRDAIRARIRKLRADGVAIVHRIGRNSGRAEVVKKRSGPRVLPTFDSTGFLQRLALVNRSRLQRPSKPSEFIAS